MFPLSDGPGFPDNDVWNPESVFASGAPAIHSPKQPCRRRYRPPTYSANATQLFVKAQRWRPHRPGDLGAC